MKNQNYKLISLSIFIIATACSTINSKDTILINTDHYNSKQKIKLRCTQSEKIMTYQIGDRPCWKQFLRISEDEKLEINFKITNKNTDDIYEHGYQELVRYKNGKIVEKLKLRRDKDAYWSEVPFVRVRKQTYLADLDNDGFLEFAIFPFSSGSAIWGTVRIFSLKNKIEYWGEGRYQFEGDTFVQLGCMSCSKFNPAECKKCY